MAMQLERRCQAAGRAEDPPAAGRVGGRGDLEPQRLATRCPTGPICYDVKSDPRLPGFQTSGPAAG